MKKYIVNYEKTFYLEVEVEAESEEKAREKADEYFYDKNKQELLDESHEGYFDYTYTDEAEE